MCCQARWKREVVQGHKFDFINIHEYHLNDWFTRLRYLFVYLLLAKSFAVYCLDIFTAITMLSTDNWTNAIYRKCGDDCVVTIKFEVAKWIFVGCIIASFVLLAYESCKARLIIRSRDIAFAYTNVMANDYYSVRDYDYFCFWCHVSESEKKKDIITGFVFFTFKDWKRLIAADGPRQSINALTLYSFAYANDFQTHDLPAYWDNSIITLLLLLSMIATVLIWLISMFLLVIAAVCYIPLLCYIQGNLKEYVCHKVDKRIAELIRRKQRQRLKRNMLLEKQLAEGAPIKDKKGQVLRGVQQPTIPVVAFDESDEDMRMRMDKGGARARPRYKQSPSDSNLAGTDYPPDQKYHPQPRRQFSTHSGNDLFDGSYPPTLEYGYQEPAPLYGGNYQHESSTNLMAGAAPPGMSQTMPTLEPQQSYEYQHHLRPSDSWEQYPSPQIADYAPIQHPYPPPPPSKRHSGLAYDDPTDELTAHDPYSRHTNPSHRS
ncbi:hypothetical protein FFLO_03550 [Filobasidium floriforme]|uniref:Vacuole protein n=1 Tax=Filobasidium floriforme TaxID=5210 RepID=A0A8K0JQT9_9TREE|nr:uncharacterized protein HD553DRAFT_220707 [Filobasidium floriforme]KAG7535952.1 hypothetical protein FFLO_03550 [Filobasidium floriforme]KAH8086558.1 hypothetical protein HD553DRAFT_220707 [Filobasidium floriforme]